MLIGAGTTINAGITAAVPLPPVTYFVDGGGGAVNEGSSALFTVTTTGLPDGTTLYWSVQHGYTSNLDFDEVGGSFQIVNGVGSFLVTTIADELTEGSEDFYVAVRTGSSSGTIVATTSSAHTVINDTSLTPPAHGSATFNGTSAYYTVPAGSHFSLGTTWTIEWWSKANHDSSDRLLTVMSQLNPGGGGIDLFYDSTTFAIGDGNGNYIRTPVEPTVGVWTHVAVVNNAGTLSVYFNGISQTLTSYVGPTLSNTAFPLAIGERGFTSDPAVINNFQYFSGELTNIRILDTAYYASNFVPAILPALVAGHTKLLWTPTDQSITTDSGSLALTMTNNNASYSSGYPTELTTYHPTAYGGPNATFSPLPPVQTGWTILGTVSGTVVYHSTVTNPSYYGNLQAADNWPEVADSPLGTVTYTFIG